LRNKSKDKINNLLSWPSNINVFNHIGVGKTCWKLFLVRLIASEFVFSETISL